MLQPRGATTRRVEALYDCQADHHDELSFSEGQVLVVLGQEDSDWWVRIIILHSDWCSHWWGKVASEVLSVPVCSCSPDPLSLSGLTPVLNMLIKKCDKKC